VWGTIIFSQGPGRNADYIIFSGSAINNATNFGLTLGYIGTFKRYQKSHAFTIRAELKF